MDSTGILPTQQDRLANGPETWLRRPPLPMRNGNERKSRQRFAELKNQIGLRRLRLRRMKVVREQFFLAAATQTIKRLVRFLSQVPTAPLAVSA